MRRFITAVGIVGLLVALIVVLHFSLALAEEPKAGAQQATWLTNFVLQNTTNVTATATVEFFNIPTQTLVLSDSTIVIGPGSTYAVRPANYPALPNGAYSSRVSSSGPLVAIANSASSIGFMSYVGLSQGGQEAFFPNFVKNYVNYNSPAYIQNISTEACTLTINLYYFATGALSKTVNVATLQPGASYKLDPADLTDVADGQYAVRATTGPGKQIVGTITQLNPVLNYYLGYNALSGGSQQVFIPNFTHKYGAALFDTPSVIQNVGTVATNLYITITSFPVSGQPDIVTTTTVSNLGAGRSYALRPYDAALGLPTNRQYSVVVTGQAGAQIVAITNQVSTAAGQKWAMSYNSVTPARTVFIPNMVNAYYNYYSNAVVQNVGSVSSTLTMTATSFAGPADFRTVTTSAEVGPGRSFVIRYGDLGMVGGKQYAIEVRANAGVGLVGIVNQWNATLAGDTAASYEAVPQA